MVRALHAAGHRGDPRRRLQPHRRGQPAGADALVPRHRQRLLLPPRRPRTRATTWTSPAAATRSTCSNPRVLQLIMDSLRYWVHGDARRRVPLRSGQHAGPRAARGRPAGGVLRHHPPGPGALAGQADRRAVGPGRRAATRSATSPCCGRSGTASTATACAASGRATAARSREFATRLCGSQRPLRAERPPAVRQHQLHHLPRRLHARTTWSATTTSTTRPTARRTATAPTTTISWNCGAEGPTDDPAIIALRERQKRNFLATLLLSQGVPMLLAGDELGHTQQGNNNAYCQDNELTWLDWDLDDRAAGVPGVRPQGDRASGTSSRCSSGGGSSRAGRIRGAGHQGHRLARSRRQGDVRRGLERRLRPVPGRAAGRRPDRRRRRARRADRRRHAAAAAQRRSRADPLHAARDHGEQSGSAVLDTAGTDGTSTPMSAAESVSELSGSSLAVLFTRTSGGSRAGRSRERRSRPCAARVRKPQPAGAAPLTEARPSASERGDRPRVPKADATARAAKEATIVSTHRLNRLEQECGAMIDSSYVEDLLRRRPSTSSSGSGRPGVDLPPAVPRRFHLPRRRGIVPYLARPGHHPLLRLALSQGRGRAARTATTSSTIERSTPRSARDEDYDALVEALCASTAWARSSTSCPITWAIVGNENPWWNDVLENGPASPYAGYFDIDWYASPRPELRDRVLLPDPGRALRRGAGGGRAAPGVRGRGLRAALLRPPLPRRAPQLRADPGATAWKSWNRTLGADAAALPSSRAS